MTRSEPSFCALSKTAAKFYRASVDLLFLISDIFLVWRTPAAYGWYG